MIYQWIVYLHILSFALFMAAHGASIVVAFRLKSAPDAGTTIALLDVSRASLVTMYVCFAALLLTGIAAGVMSGYWATIWFWASLVVLILTVVAMMPLGVTPFSNIRKYAGVKYAVRGKWFDPEPADPAKMKTEIAALKPGLLTVIAIGGVAIILWMMMFKPF
jgi:hypothetical protein